MTQLLFVCTGNVFRSLTAELALRRELGANSTVVVSSAGTEHAPELTVRSDVAEYLAHKGLDATRHVRRTLTRDVIQSADVVIAMSTDHQVTLAKNFGIHAQLYTGASGTAHEPLPDVSDLFRREDYFGAQAKDHIYRTIDRIIELAPALARTLIERDKARTHNAPVILGCQPTFNVDSSQSAVAHYVDWLGFTFDWDWRGEPGQPSIASVSRDGLSLFLMEGGAPETMTLRVQVSNLSGLVAEWNEKRPGAVTVILEPPYDLPTAYVRDPSGNVMALQQPQTSDEERAKRAISGRIRHYLTDLIETGCARPTPDQIVKQVGGTPGIASEVLGEFATWNKDR